MERTKKQRKHENRHIFEELQYEILLRLPAKSVVRFKSVSQTWQSMLDSRSFVDSYNRHHHSIDYYPDEIVYSPLAGTAAKRRFPWLNSIQMVAGPSHLRLPNRMRRVSFPYHYNGYWRRVYSVFGPLNNGIYCVVANLHDDGGRRVFINRAQIAFCNPAIHDYKFTKPYPSHSRALLSDISLSYTFPRRVNYGFGFSKVQTKTAAGYCFDYKIVVAIHWELGLSSFLSFVYSLHARQWKKIADYRNVEGLYPEITPDLELCPQRFFNGCWHWMAKGGGHDGHFSVLSFNFGDEAFKSIGGPAGYKAYDLATKVHTKGGVLLLNDHLVAIYLFHVELPYDPKARKRPMHFVGADVWMMMEYGVVESWTRIYTVKTCSAEIRRIVGIWTRPLRDDEIERIFFEGDSGEIFSVGESGYKSHGVCEFSSFICWNTPGISSYKETIERL